MQNNKDLITKKTTLHLRIPNSSTQYKRKKKRKRKGKGKVKTQMSLMIAMHTSPNCVASSHVASVP